MRVVATAGHVDHGKSSLVRALTGTDPDRFLEEKQRGLTIDLGFAWMTLPGLDPVLFVDVPGHVRFISNMLAGVAVVEAGLLVVDAREGWRAQTEEHLRILDLLAIPAGIVAITKSALVDADRITEVRARTAGTMFAGAPVIACDSLDGAGLDELRARLAEAVTAGGDRAATTQRGDRPRLWVDRSFTIAGAGTVVTGGIDHGTLVAGDHVVAVGAHGATETRIRGIQALHHRVEAAPAGTRAALNLAGIDRRAIRRGDAIVRPDDWHLTTIADTTLSILADIDHEVTDRGAYLVYLGTGEHLARIRLLERPSPEPGEPGTARMRWRQRLPLVAGDRFVLRESGRGELVGGGALVDVAPRRARRGAGTATSAPASLPLVAEGEWVRADELARRLGTDVAATVGDWVVAPNTLRAAVEALTAQLAASRPIGLDVARLDDRQRAVLAALEREHAAEVVAGYAVAHAWRDELAAHPMVKRLERDLFSPVAPAAVTPDELRALVRRGLVLV